MNKTLINFWLDCVLLVLFCTLVWVSVVLRFVFPVGPEVFEWTLWGWDYLQWGNIQFVILCLFAGAVLLHVMLHWSWVMGVIKKRLVKQKIPGTHSFDTIYGVILLILFLHLYGIAYLIAIFTAKGPS